MSTYRPAVFVASSIQDLARVVARLLPQVEVKNLCIQSEDTLSEEDWTDLRDNAEVLFADVPIIKSALFLSSKLKWAHSTWAGVEPLINVVDPLKPPDVIVTRTGSGFGNLMAEYVLGYIISMERKFPQMANDQKAKEWNPHLYKRDVRLLSQLRLGILGAGQIGTQIGTLCKSVGMEVWGLTRSPKIDNIGPFDAYRTKDQLVDILQNCDYICNVLPSTSETKGLLSGDMLSHCKTKKSTFINVGRGNIVDENSLIKAIENQWIAGAVLDVFESEPLSRDSELWSLPNVVITPHVSGPCITVPVAKTFTTNYQKYITGDTLDYVVKWASGY
ncbi:glyoxylate/hydroxypyruvate reductase A-like isoform X2 [Pecten maximus]|uniref:glyoxylate/hydroxypyruvate reductase A-like isoform X1 n=1 Tax=Pecten maximus TaxID=6579 RepID=UPI0014580608|nr:glyoxylate/hydroxypyruvate reductase A-like isoform X1 [Pecten maximus]XP_033745112.1 glyoxylate/hydroxypyruvate reductase A-like isoform X2 [Pecten maximus]